MAGLPAGGWPPLHQKWIEIVGVVFGCVSGLVYVVQMAVLAEKKTSMGDEGQNGTGKGTPDPQTMTQETHPIVDLTNEDLDAMLRRALRKRSL